MSEFTEGELEEKQSCCNSIDLLSKEDGSIVTQITECDEDELSDLQRANAKELVRRWNAFEENGLVIDLQIMCEEVRNLLSDVVIPMGAKKNRIELVQQDFLLFLHSF